MGQEARTAGVPVRGYMAFRCERAFSIAPAISYDHDSVREQAFKLASMTMSDDTNSNDRTTTGVVVKTRPKTKKPSMYKVLMLNDDYTPMEFVVHVLEKFFQKNREEATTIMLHVHQKGVGVCGVYTYEVAETKVTEVMDFARRHQHPLQCTLEKD
jgi:ATP-dependent Clp protease adaptor protein ClpS